MMTIKKFYSAQSTRCIHKFKAKLSTPLPHIMKMKIANLISIQWTIANPVVTDQFAKQQEKSCCVLKGQAGLAMCIRQFIMGKKKSAQSTVKGKAGSKSKTKAKHLDMDGSYLSPQPTTSSIVDTVQGNSMDIGHYLASSQN